jgi:hypothetical protein
MGLFGSSDRRAARATIRAAQIGAEAQLQAQEKALEAQERGFQRANQLLSPFQVDTSEGFELFNALTGGLGVDAQREAFSNLPTNPAVEFARDQGVNLINNKAAATGGLGGGNVLRDLTEFGTSLAIQEINSLIDNLAKSQNVQFDVAGSLANLATGLGGAEAQIQSNIGNIRANEAQAIGEANRQRLLSQGNRFNAALASGIGFATGNPDLTVKGISNLF